MTPFVSNHKKISDHEILFHLFPSLPSPFLAASWTTLHSCVYVDIGIHFRIGKQSFRHFSPLPPLPIRLLPQPFLRNITIDRTVPDGWLNCYIWIKFYIAQQSISPLGTSLLFLFQLPWIRLILYYMCSSTLFGQLNNLLLDFFLPKKSPPKWPSVPPPPPLLFYYAHLCPYGKKLSSF